QARSLGFSTIFAGQDLPAFQKASKEEAASIGANTNIKICMKLEDPLETWDFFTKTAGEAYVTKVDSFQAKDSSMANTYADSKSSSFEKRSRVDLLDLKEQTEGEAHIFFKSKIVRARMFYANPKPVKQLKLNQFLKVEAPPDDYLMKLQKQLASFQTILESGDLSINKVVENEEISLISTLLNESNIEEPIERGVAALIAFHGHNEPEPVEDLIEEEVEGALTIFAVLRTNANDPPILVSDKATFSEALLPINETRNQMMNIERLSGAKDKYAGTVANELIKDFQLATSYPPEERDIIDSYELTSLVKELSDKFVVEREKAKKKNEDEFS
ncbi:MAG: TraM recognition domain-containing protein, partial [Legionella longbeachae]|nr:TraM recognition domain-containing protein [Legionella longbeachae]